MMSDGGKLSIFYTISNSGKNELKRLLLDDLSENPVQFLSNARIKISCASFLDSEERKKMFFSIKSLAMQHKSLTESMLEDEYNQYNFYQKIILDNALCDFKNFIAIVEGLEKDNARNS